MFSFSLIALFSLFPFQNQIENRALTPGEYQQVKASIDGIRRSLADRYNREPDKRDAILHKSSNLLAELVMRDLAPAWYGTPWDFNGTSEIPRSGSIACGYFVTTILRDLGFRLPRVKLAQAPSERMIRSLVAAEHIYRFSDRPIDEFIDAVKTLGPGLYVVGLDMHTGLIVCDAQSNVWFIHSSYHPPYQVVKEPAASAYILTTSKYRVLGNLSDPGLLKKWLFAERIN